MSDDMNNHINSIEYEMKKLQRSFFEKWNNIVRKKIKVYPGFDIQNYIDLFGGYWLDKDEYNKMNSVLKSFFNTSILKKNRVFLRGYDYYQADPLMHMWGDNCSFLQLWDIFQKKWERYRKINTFEYINASITIEDWVGTLGFLEYIFSDLTSLRWFIFRNGKLIKKSYGESYSELVFVIKDFTDVIGKAIAGMLLFDFDMVNDLLSREYCQKIKSIHIQNLIETRWEKIEKASIRTIREGDSTVLIYAAYLMKLKPFCIEKKWKRICLISNAFGAMNIGVIIQHLVNNLCEVEHINLLFAQHRSEGDYVYSDELIGKCCFIDDDKSQLDNDVDAVFIVDDSVCFGKSYKNIKDSLDHKVTYLLPLTLNCNGLKYFRIGLTKNDNLEDIIQRSIYFSKEINDIYPAFFSFWDFRNKVPENFLCYDKTYSFALYGSDLLLRHLWRMYYESITK